MPRFKNTGTVPCVVGDGITVAPGGFVTIAKPDESHAPLTEVPDHKSGKAERPTTRSRPADKESQ